MASKRLLLLAGILALGLSAVFAQSAGTADKAKAAEAPAAAPAAQAPVENALVAAENAPADSAKELNYYIDRSEGEPRFIQRLIWEKAEYVLRYEVTVEKQEKNGSFTEVERRESENTFAEFSLVAGRYRYKVDIYDLLDELSFTTEWREFDIVRALQPQLRDFNPKAFYLDEDEKWEITLNGHNLIPESQIYLVEGGVRIRPESKIASGDSAHLVFSAASLATGDFDVYVINPGGLDTSLGKFSITNRKPFDLNFSLGYAPIVPLYGYLFKSSSVEAPFPDSFYPLGLAAKVSFIPYKRAWGNMGIEASGSLAKMSNSGEFYTTKAYFLNTHLSFLYQMLFYKKTMALNFSLGAGLTTPWKFHYEYPVGPPTENKTTYLPSVMAGVSCMVFFARPFFFSAGIDYIHVFSPESPMPGFLRPAVMAGVQM